MRRHRVSSRAGAIVVAVAVAAVFGACGASGTATSQHPAGKTAASTSADVSGAKAAIASYVGHPSAFPATVALAKRPPAGSTFVYLQCSTPICAQIGEVLAGPTHALGVRLLTIDAGSTATSSQAAAAAALAKKPAAVLLPAVDSQLFGGALHHLVSAGIAVTGVGIIDGAPYGVQETIGGVGSTDLAGRLMADWVISREATRSDVVFFGTPELSFSAPMQSAFAAEMKERCPSCRTSYQPISVTTFASTAPSQVVSYLQAHPEVNTAVFATMEAATGLAAALKDAGMHITTLGFAPSPSNLQDIKDGGLTAGLGLDLLVQEWDQVNVTARLLAHQSTPASNLSVDLEFLTAQDVTPIDIREGWTGYPDVGSLFAKLWSSKA